MDYTRTEKAPVPIGPYEQAVCHGGTVYVSMQIPVDPTAPDAPIPDSVEEQAKLALGNIEAILNASESGMANTLRIMIYVTDITTMKLINPIYEGYFQDHKPARGVIEVSVLPMGCKIAMDAIAAQKN